MHDCEEDKDNKYYCYNCNPDRFKLNDEEDNR